MESQSTSRDLYEISEVQLIYRTAIKPSQRPVITTSHDAHAILLSIWNKDLLEYVEEFKVLLLNRSNRVLGAYAVSSGGITGTVADPRLILTAALKASAVAIILAHNHPSGGVKPSRIDIELTQKIKTAGSYLDTMVVDHIILSSEEYYSFADEGLL
jgi:DNA repair protein RadC